MSKSRILCVLAIVILLMQYLYVSYYEPKWFNTLITNTITEYYPLSDPVPLTQLNVSGIQASIYNDNQTKQINEKQTLALCPLTPPDLNGTIPLLVPAKETLEYVAQQLSWLRILKGGHHEPLDCQARYKVAIIVPYRDRLSNLCTFLLNMHPFLTKQKLDYTIFIVEQFDNCPFNRGKLMNVGFTEALKLRDYDCFIFHDVDNIPENDRNMYSCPDQPRHMAVAVERFNYKMPDVKYFGGVIGLSRDHFQLVNGFSNVFWGWGSEDDDIALRVEAHGLNIIRYPENVARYHTLSHVRQKANPNRNELKRSGWKRFNTDGLNSLVYRLKSLKELSLFTYIQVDLIEGSGC